MVDFMIAGLFFLVFAHALVGYVRRRDGLQRDVMLVFSATAGIFVIALARRGFGAPPPWVTGPAAFFLLCQPYLTLRVVARLRSIPAWVLWSALVVVLGTAAPFLPGAKRSVVFALAAVTAFAVVNTVAAIFLGLEARRRSGSSRVRLWTAAVATVAWGLSLFAAGAGSGGTHPMLGTIVRGVVFASALAYAAAFVPPKWLRRWWAASASQAVAQRIFRAPATETPEQTWQRYAEAVCEVTGADAAVVLLSAAQGTVAETAWARVPPDRDAIYPVGQLDELLRAQQPIGVHPGTPDSAGLAVLLAQRTGARFVTAVPLQTSGGQGALLVLNVYRRLFSDDDVSLLGEFGVQTAVLAERGAVLAEQARLSAELAASVRAFTHASKAKSDFLAGMNHELRTPLNSIVGFSELMRSEETLPGDGRRLVPSDWIEHVYTSGRHLLALISDLLDLAKVESGRIDLEPEPVDLPRLITDVITTLRPLSDQKRLAVTVDVPVLTAAVDRIRFRQILDNLVSNAIKFTPVEGQLRIGARRVAAQVAISVADTGVGIARSEQERVFEEFAQVGDATARQAGTGLGLALARRLAEAHGGSIELESEPGRGSTFTVFVPWTDGRRELDQAPATDAVPVRVT